MTAPARSLRLFESAPVASSATKKKPPERSRLRRAQAWLALHFHNWSLHAAMDKLAPQIRAEFNSQPLAVLDSDRQRRVLACNPAAWEQGIRPGHALNAAIALCAETHFLTRDPLRETQLLETVADWAQRYTPLVSIEAPNELLLEVRGSLRLFGGAAALVEKITQELHAQHLEASVALSPTARSALWLARRPQAVCIVPPRILKTQLAPLSIRCLHWPDDIELRLRRFGVRAIGDILRLPRADLARRIGVHCMHELDDGLGRRAETRTAFRQLEPYRDRVVLDFEIETHALLEPLLVMRLENLQTFLRERNLTVADLRIELMHREGLTTPLRIGLAVPTADMKHLAKLLRERLAQLSLPAPVIEVRLDVEHLFAARGVSIDLFQKNAEGGAHLTQAERLGRLLEQLRARLGDSTICALRTQDDHRPEKAQANVSAEPSIQPRKYLSGALPLRPLWLLREPRLLGSGEQPPAELYPLRGPERIETGWWDDLPAQRDYFVAKNRDGSLCWIFRKRVPPFEWYLHGLFA